MEFLQQRFKEPSTWVSLVSLAAAFGLFTQDQSNAIASLILALSGVQGFVTKA